MSAAQLHGNRTPSYYEVASVPGLRQIDYQLPKSPDFARSWTFQSSTAATNDKERPPRTTRSISPSRKCGSKSGEFPRKTAGQSPSASRSRHVRDDGTMESRSRRSTRMSDRPIIGSIGSRNMWRAFFLGIGVYLMIAGAECLAVDRVFWRRRRSPRRRSIPFRSRPPRSRRISPRPLGPLEPLVHGGRGLPLLLYHPASGWAAASK